jgi:hypothetical protein
VLTTLPPLCTDCLEIWDPQPPGFVVPFTLIYRIKLGWTFICISSDLIPVMLLTIYLELHQPNSYQSLSSLINAFKVNLLGNAFSC